MTEPQMLTVIGLSTLFLAMYAGAVRWFARVVREEVGMVRTEVNAVSKRLDTRFG